MSNSSGATETARNYYNSEDADNFYFAIWGGEDIHIGLYDSPDEPIRDASRKTVAKMAGMLKGLKGDSKVLDLGSGFGGAARYLAKEYGCQVECLNLSEKENERNRQLSSEQGLSDKISVTDGSFENLPYEDSSFDFVWSEDAFLHSGQREKIFEEISRVLKPGGELIFTDPMQSDNPSDIIQKVLQRIHLSSLGSIAFYKEVAAKNGMEEVEILDLTKQLPTHYGRVKQELEKNYEKLSHLISKEYKDKMLEGLQNWVTAGNSGDMAWGILHFRKK